jgi:hypothetical protein
MAAFERASMGLFLWWSANAALIDNAGKVLSVSRFDVDETAARLESGARAHGLRVLDRTDHAAEAQQAGYRLRPTQSLLVDRDPGRRPLKLVVWQARSGLTLVSLDGHRQDQSTPVDPDLPRLLQTLAPERLESTLA